MATRSPRRTPVPQPAYVLQRHDWSESSLIVELFTRGLGRVVTVARGAKKPTSNYRPLLLPFQPVMVMLGAPPKAADDAGADRELLPLRAAEWAGGQPLVRGAALFSAFYLNELLVRLLPRNDAHAPLFASYVQTLRELERDGGSRATLLRSFELDVLREMGYAPALDHCAAGRPIDSAGWYRVDAQQGLLAVSGPLDEMCLRGSSIIALARRDLSQPQAAADSKVLLRQLIRYHLNGQPLNTRRILQDLRRLELELP